MANGHSTQTTLRLAAGERRRVFTPLLTGGRLEARIGGGDPFPADDVAAVDAALEPIRVAVRGQPGASVRSLPDRRCLRFMPAS